jgi:hypothetical protein
VGPFSKCPLVLSVPLGEGSYQMEKQRRKAKGEKKRK